MREDMTSMDDEGQDADRGTGSGGAGQRLTRDPQLVDTGFDGGGFEGGTNGDEGQQAAKEHFAGVLVDGGAGVEELVLQPCPEETGRDGADGHWAHGAAGWGNMVLWRCSHLTCSAGTWAVSETRVGRRCRRRAGCGTSACGQRTGLGIGRCAQLRSSSRSLVRACVGSASRS